jgi:superfamily II DNA/RNA helicase
MQLRKICNHPYLFFTEGWDIDATMIKCSGKFQLLDRMLPKLKAGGHRVLIFTQMTQIMELISQYCSFRGYNHLLLSGSTPAEERERNMYRWNNPDSPDFVFCLSTRAGGLGLNLASADTVIIFDSDWNPTADAQASDRAHRIGQKQEVRVFRLVSKNSVEETIVKAAAAKNSMSSIVVEAGGFDNVDRGDGEEKTDKRKMMESLLGEEEGGGEESQDEGEAGEMGDLFLNEKMATSGEEYDLYCRVDEERKGAGDYCELFRERGDVPDFLKHEELEEMVEVLGEREKGSVLYTDGLTEKEFTEQVEREFEAEEEGRKTKRRKKG